MRKWLGAVLLVALGLFAINDRVVGTVVAPFLEYRLSDLFGMPVSIRGLSLNLLQNHVQASRLTFHNQAQFSNRPHFDIRGLACDINFKALRDKRIEIETLHLDHPYYLIERVPSQEGPRNNVTTWFHHIRQKVKKKGPSPEGEKWQIHIQKIALHEATFVFHDTSAGQEKKLVFSPFEGYVAQFVWPTASPTTLTQKVFLKGQFGEKVKAPFWIRGDANFATSQVSFRLDGEIQDGDVLEQKSFWEGLPVQVTEGRFDLKLRTFCIRKKLLSHARLTLKSVKVVPGPSAVDKIWGLPIATLMTFLQEHRRLSLNIRVHGDISDPKFEFMQAFRRAFQESLQHRTQKALNLLVEAPVKLARQTGAVVVENLAGKLMKEPEPTTGMNETVSSSQDPVEQEG